MPTQFPGAVRGVASKMERCFEKSEVAYAGNVLAVRFHSNDRDAISRKRGCAAATLLGHQHIHPCLAFMRRSAFQSASRLMPLHHIQGAPKFGIFVESRVRGKLHQGGARGASWHAM